MTETLIPADPEAAGLKELAERLPDLGYDALDYGTKIAANRPSEFVRVLAMGGGARDLVTDLHTVRVEVFAVKEVRAQRICAFAVAALQAAGRAGRLGGVTCYGVDVAALPQNLPHPQVPDRHRYFATLTLALRRVPA